MAEGEDVSFSGVIAVMAVSGVMVINWNPSYVNNRDTPATYFKVEKIMEAVHFSFPENSSK